jgi:hypothetical protein
MLDYDLKIRQKEGTNSLLKKYLSRVPSRSDTLYAILFRPMNCPRCEDAIPFFTETMEKLYPESETIVISTYEDIPASLQYIKQKKYAPDYLMFDATRGYDAIFSFNSSDLQGLYILKIDKQSGRLIVGGEPYILSNEFVHEIQAFKEPLPYYTYDKEEDAIVVRDKSKRPSLSYEIFPVYTDSLHPISGVYDIPLMFNDIFIYSDELANAAYYFHVDKEKKTIDFKDIFVVDSTERDRYIDIPEDLYLSKKRSGGLHYIALGVNRIGNNQIGLSYSLPRLLMESPTTIAHYNKASIIVRNLQTIEREPMISLDFDIFNETYMYTHFNFFPLNDENIILGCKKITWPMEMEIEEYKGQIELDPFMEEFYSTECPYLAIFDIHTGKMLQRFGQLDISQKLSRTGYYYLNPIADCNKEEIVYGNGYVGKLYLAERNNPSMVKKEITVFDINTCNFPTLDSLFFYKLEHAKAYNPFFNRCIETIALANNIIHCIVRTGLVYRNIQNDEYEYIAINKENGEILCRYNLIEEFDDERILCFGLAKENDIITPYYFSKRDNKAYIKKITKI